jgi:xylulose-5-phosphate/fructose-6-phosphate phosphoketolase
MNTATLTPTDSATLSPELLHKMNAYWRAANYLSVGQIYLYDNPLLKEPLKLAHVKPLVGMAALRSWATYTSKEPGPTSTRT